VQDHQPQVALGEGPSEPGSAAAAAMPPMAEGVRVQAVFAAGEAPAVAAV
jgi:hypothetical protein